MNSLARRIAAVAVAAVALAPMTGTVSAAAEPGELKKVNLPFLWPRTDVVGLAAAAPDGVWIVGSQGRVVNGYVPPLFSFTWSRGNPFARRWDGRAWREHALPGYPAEESGPIDIDTVAPNDVWVGNRQSYLARYDGTAFQPVASPLSDGVLEAGPGGVWLRGTKDRVPTSYRREGSGWKEYPLPPDRYTLKDISAPSADRTFAFVTRRTGAPEGQPQLEGAVLRFDGEQWRDHTAGIDLIHGGEIAVKGPDDLWVASWNEVHHWNGSSWTQLISDSPGATRYTQELVLDGKGGAWTSKGPQLFRVTATTAQPVTVTAPPGWSDQISISALAVVPGTNALWTVASYSPPLVMTDTP